MKLPQEIIADVENESVGIGHGVIYLELHFRDNNIHFYKINREKSIVTLSKNLGLSSNSLQGKESEKSKTKNEKKV